MLRGTTPRGTIHFEGMTARMLPRTQVSALVMDVIGVAMPEFQAMIADRAAIAVEWVSRSIQACKGQGAAGYYSRFHHPLSGWSAAWPEATGKIIPTLLRYNRFANRQDLAALAAAQARWLVSIQSLDGSFPGGFHYPGTKGEPSVYNTGQVMLGLLAAFDQTREQEFLDSAAGAARWLCDELNTGAGNWLPQPDSSFQPAHYTTVCWAMLEVFKRTQEKRVRGQALRALQTMAAWLTPNGAVKNWGLHPDRPAFTDNIADTLRGFWECGRLLGDEGRPYRKISARAAAALREQFQSKGKLAGAYDSLFRADQSFACLPGHCGLAQIWLTLAEKTGDVGAFRTALECIYFVMRKQKMRAAGTGNRGGIAGSSPLWGRYWPLKHTTVAATSFLDALMLLQEVISRSSLEQTQITSSEKAFPAHDE